MSHLPAVAIMLSETRLAACLRYLNICKVAFIKVPCYNLLS